MPLYASIAQIDFRSCACRKDGNNSHLEVIHIPCANVADFRWFPRNLESFLFCVPFPLFSSPLHILFLHQQVDVVDSEGRQLLDWALQRHEQAAEGDVCVSAVQRLVP